MTYVEAESLRSKFYEAIRNTTINTGSYIVPVNKNSDKSVVIKLIVSDENNYPINVTKVFTDVKKLETFVNTLTNLKILAKNRECRIELIPVYGTDIQIYINGEIVNPETLPNYIDQMKFKNRRNIQNLMFDIECLSRQLEYLNHQINDTQMNLNAAENLITAVNNTKEPKKQEKFIKEHTPIKENATLSTNAYDYIVDLNVPIECAKKYALDTDKDKKEATKTMKEFFEQIQVAIMERKVLLPNYFDIYEKLTVEDMMIVEKFLEQLRNKMTELRNVTQNNLDIKQKVKNLQISAINNAVESKENVVEKIKNLKVIKTKSEECEFVPKYPVIQEKFVTYNIGGFSKEISPEDEVFADIQVQQLQKLTPEERDALMYYKTMLYRPINTVVAYIRAKGMTLKEVGAKQEELEHVINLISACYDEFIERKEKIDKSFFGKFRNLHILSSSNKAIDRLFGKYPDKTPSKKEYIELVITSIPLLESALSKVITTKDIILYRSSPQLNLIEDGRFLSTSISLSAAKAFTSDADRYKRGETSFPNIFKITIPAGSHVIAYTDDLYTDNYDENFVFNEYQHEVLIDPKHFDFKQVYLNSQRVNDNLIAGRIEYNASPREVLYTDDIAKTI